MSSIGEQIARERSQYRVIVGLSVGVVALATVLQSFDPLIFPRFIGRTHPLIAIPLVSALGIVLLSLLLGRGWFRIYRREHLKWLWRCSALGALFALVTVALDLKVVPDHRPSASDGAGACHRLPPGAGLSNDADGHGPVSC
jgi:H+/Cl- antiporter ClcA